MDNGEKSEFGNNDTALLTTTNQKLGYYHRLLTYLSTWDSEKVATALITQSVADKLQH
jgi:hypothetical protein